MASTTRLATRRRLKAAAAVAAAAASATGVPIPVEPEATFVTKVSEPPSTGTFLKKPPSKDKTKGPTSTAKRNLQAIFEEKLEGRKSKWETGVVLPKLVVLLVLIVGIGSMVWNSQWEAPPSIPAASGRVSQLEDVMRRTNKWMQVQLDLLDNKIGEEVDGIRSDMASRIDEKSVLLEAQMKKLKAQVQSVDDSLNMLYKEDFLSREETLQLIKSAVEKRAEQGDDRALSLDDVRLAARQLVQNELEIHSADGIGRADYALESGGGQVVFHSDGFFKGLHWSKMGLHIVPGIFRKHPMSDRILRPSFGEPGQCLPLKGSNVFVDIRLRSDIYPEAITLEHLSKKVAYDIGSAPKDFKIFGWNDGNVSSFSEEKAILLGEFVYDIDKGRIQTFTLLKSSELINMIRLHVVSNHGCSTHTCIYRLRVHGSPSDASSS